MASAGGGACWTEEVEDLVDHGDIDGAISLLQSVISELETSGDPAGKIRLAAAISDLAGLQSNRGLSMEADALRSRVLLLRSSHGTELSPSHSARNSEAPGEKGAKKEEIRVSSLSSDPIVDEDDWESMADRAVPDKGLLPSREVGIPSKADSCEEIKPSATKRRGRGSFLYQKSCLYSDQHDAVSSSSNKFDSGDDEHRREDMLNTIRESGYGTRHILVLYDISPTTRTIDLEKIFNRFEDRGLAIRWVNDTTALALFQTPSIALEAQSTVRCPFKVRTLDDGDSLLDNFSLKDLEPPYPRPKTSARTAQRLIAHGMGLKPFTKSASDEFKQQEVSRKNRILARQSLKDDAWGSD